MNLRRYSRLIGGDEGRIRLDLPSSMKEVRLRDAKSHFEEDLVKYKWYREKMIEVFNEL